MASEGRPVSSWYDRYFETQHQVDTKRREDLLASFEAATVTKAFKPTWRPTQFAYGSHRVRPSPVIDNWSAAFKVRQFWEEQTERRKAAGKVIF